MKSHLYKYLVLVFFGAVALIVSTVWAFNGDQTQSKSELNISKSNIAHHKDDRVRFVPDNFFSVDFVNKSHGWAAGYYGTILKTMDGGENWTHISLPDTDLIRRIQFLDKFKKLTTKMKVDPQIKLNHFLQFTFNFIKMNNF